MWQLSLEDMPFTVSVRQMIGSFVADLSYLTVHI